MSSLHKKYSASIAFSLAAISLALGVTIPPSRAQAAAEAAGTPSIAATATSQAKPPAFSTMPATENQTKPGHLPLPSGPPPDVVNRRDLEQRAGRNAAKLLVRSDPRNSQVWINGAFVGTSPMFLILAPGKYQLEFRGPRQESATRAVDLLPHETREIAPTLTAHFPTKVIIR